ncbi:6-phospho-3-hexuloisomerase [Lachnospiraceae bacterium 62-35]
MDGKEYRNQMIDELSRTLIGLDDIQVDKMIEAIISAKRIFFAGAGRAGLMMKGFAMRLMHMGYECHVAGDATTPSIQTGDLLIVASGKAETKTSSHFVDVAKEAGAKAFVITANPQGSVAQKADGILVLIAPKFRGDPDHARCSVQPMGNRFEQSALLAADYIVKLIKEKMNLDIQVMYHNHSTLE